MSNVLRVVRCVWVVSVPRGGQSGESVAVLDVLHPRCGPGAKSQAGACERAGKAGDRVGIALPLGMLSLLENDLERATRLAEESFATAHETGNRRMTLVALVGLARVAYRRSDYPRAAARFQESLKLAQELGTRREIGQGVEGAMWLATAVGRSREAARLAGAAEAVRASIPAPLSAPVSTAHPAMVNGRALVVFWPGASTKRVALLLVACTVTFEAVTAALKVPVSMLRANTTNVYVPGLTATLNRKPELVNCVLPNADAMSGRDSPRVATPTN